MEIKDIVSITIAKDKLTYSFNIPVGATLGEAFDACFECLNAILDMQKKAIQKPEEKAGDE